MDDWKKVINILKYLNYTKDRKIIYKGKGEILSYAGDPLTKDLNGPKMNELTNQIFNKSILV